MGAQASSSFRLPQPPRTEGAEADGGEGGSSVPKSSRSSGRGMGGRSEEEEVKELLQMIDIINCKAHLFPDKETLNVHRFQLLAVPRKFPDMTKEAKRKSFPLESKYESESSDSRVYVCDLDAFLGEGKVETKAKPKKRKLECHSDIADETSRSDNHSFQKRGGCEQHFNHNSSADISEFRVAIFDANTKSGLLGKHIKSDRKDGHGQNFRLISPGEFRVLFHEITTRCGMLSESLVKSVLSKTSLAGTDGKLKKKCVDNETEDGELCQICFENPVNVVLGCTHSFCEACLDGWVASHATCPMCRAQMDLKSESKGDVGWVLTTPDEDLQRIGRESLEGIWASICKFPRVLGSISTVFQGRATIVTSSNYDDIRRRQSLKRIQALFHRV